MKSGIYIRLKAITYARSRCTGIRSHAQCVFYLTLHSLAGPVHVITTEHRQLHAIYSPSMHIAFSCSLVTPRLRPFTKRHLDRTLCGACYWFGYLNVTVGSAPVLFLDSLGRTMSIKCNLTWSHDSSSVLLGS